MQLKQKACLSPELSPKFLSTLGSNPARTRPEKPGPTYNSASYRVTPRNPAPGATMLSNAFAFRFSSQAATCLPVYHNSGGFALSLLFAERHAGKPWMPNFLVFGLNLIRSNLSLPFQLQTLYPLDHQSGPVPQLLHNMSQKLKPSNKILNRVTKAN